MRVNRMSDKQHICKDIRDLLASGLDCNVQDVYGNSCLHYSCVNARSDIKQLLLKRLKVKERCPSKEKYLKLFSLCIIHGVRCTQTLIEFGCKVSIRNMLGHSSLYVACYNDHLDVLRYLIPEEQKVVRSDVKKYLAILSEC
jgi:ankyrin repeat protein